MDSICCMPIMWLWRVRELIELFCVAGLATRIDIPKVEHGICVTKKKIASLESQTPIELDR
jgi:hypothetical protein